MKHIIRPWGIERTFSHLWIGPLREDDKVDEIVCGLDIEGLKPEALERQLEIANLIASAPELFTAAQSMLSRLKTVPVNYTIPKLCIGDFNRWESVVGKANHNPQ